MVNRKNFFCSWIDNLGEMKNGGTNKLEFYDYSFNTGKRFFFSNLGCERDFCKINFFFLFSTLNSQKQLVIIILLNNYEMIK